MAGALNLGRGRGLPFWNRLVCLETAPNGPSSNVFRAEESNSAMATERRKEIKRRRKRREKRLRAKRREMREQQKKKRP